MRCARHLGAWHGRAGDGETDRVDYGMGLPQRIEGIIGGRTGVSMRAISLLALSAGSAQAAPLPGIPDGMSGMLAAGGLAAFAAGLALFLAARRKARRAEGLRERVSELEHRLTETENLLAAEPHAMIVWEGGEDAPTHVSARLHVVSSVPRSEERLVRFAWRRHCTDCAPRASRSTSPCAPRAATCWRLTDAPPATASSCVSACRWASGGEECGRRPAVGQRRLAGGSGAGRPGRCRRRGTAAREAGGHAAGAS